MPLRILVVDDFEPFRRYIRSVLKPHTDFKIIGEASDGLEAIQKAAELQPDFVLLDISLPRLNGLAAAKQIRISAPSAKILIVSQESSFDVIETALRLGVAGYLHKLRAGRELLPAIEALRRDEYFVSTTLKQESRESTPESPICHEVQFYFDDESLLDGFTGFTAAQLQTGKAVIVVATQAHCSGVLERLNARSVDVDHAIASGKLIVLDTVDTLSSLMAGGVLDPDRFFNVFRDLIETAKAVAPQVATCGEIAPQLLASGKLVQALRLEQLWDLAAHAFIIDTLCGYSLEGIDKDSSICRSICAEHSMVRFQ